MGNKYTYWQIVKFYQGNSFLKTRVSLAILDILGKVYGLIDYFM